MTRQHKAMNHSSEYDNLKKVVLEFANNATSSYVDKDAMQIGQIGAQAEGQGGQWEHREDGEEGKGWGHHYEGGFHALGGKGGGGRQCYNCHGYGHLARDCPSKGKNKVKVGTKVQGKDGVKEETGEETEKVRRADNIGMNFQKEEKGEREPDPHMVHVGVVVEIITYQIVQIKKKEKAKA
jgi:hypothetical protein